MQQDNTSNAGEQEVPVEASSEDVGKTAEQINAEIEQELEEAAEAEPQPELTREEALEVEVAELKDKLIRSIADLENFRKRTAREKADAIRFGNQRLIEDLLPVIDNFGMGMAASEQDAGSMIYMGMQMVQKQLDGFLEGQGVQEVKLKPGEVFDPKQHDAMSQEVSEEFEEGQIIRIMRKGYMMGDRLIRPANVVVAQSAEAAGEQAED
ncbi:nucleotide exchange factor GrpE [Rubritalea marina]|uniref:nucleotide exchange factor GrpE n=1 Tax=Rubritalea marina TaxID=361055 RepID=UPI000370521E|nr:nucleotide exchange factor GrpE [Rubritalea marina]